MAAQPLNQGCSWNNTASVTYSAGTSSWLHSHLCSNSCDPGALPKAMDAQAEVATLSNYTGLCENSALHCGAQGRLVRRHEQVWGHRSPKVLQEAGTRLRMQSGPRAAQGHQYNQLWLAHFTLPGIWISHNPQQHNTPVLCDKLKQFKWDFI